MRLLRIPPPDRPTLDHTTLEFEEFDDDKAPRYAILSHMWSDGLDPTYAEVSKQDVIRGTNTHTVGYRKMIGFIRCVRRIAPTLRYVWIDTCCIDHEKKDEVSKSINAMFRWYQDAQICVAYLRDVKDTEDTLQFRCSRWFKRGWTLQELLAPRLVVFVTDEWETIGYKGSAGQTAAGIPVSETSLEQVIFEVTGIPTNVLKDFAGNRRRLRDEDIFQWISERETKQPEDLYYSLIGIFGVRMCLSYGEGAVNARLGLEEAIEKTRGREAKEELSRLSRLGSASTETSKRGHTSDGFKLRFGLGKRNNDRDSLGGPSATDQSKGQPCQRVWALQLSQKGVRQCVASPQKTHIAFVYSKIVDVFDLNQLARGSSRPVHCFDAEKLYDRQTTWETCCFSSNHLFLVPSSTRGLFKLLIYSFGSTLEARPIKVEVTSRYKIELIAATTTVEMPLLACVVLDTIDVVKSWGILPIPLNGLSEWSRPESSSSSRNSASHTAAGTLPHREASRHFALLLASPEMLYVPSDLPEMKYFNFRWLKYLDLQFCPNRPTLVLTTKNSDQNAQKHAHLGVSLWWWDLDHVGSSMYRGHSFHENKGRLDLHGRMYTSTAVATDRTAFVILDKNSVWLRTPVPANALSQVPTIVGDQIIPGRKAMFRLVVTHPSAPHDVYFVAEGSTRKKRHLIGVYRETLKDDLTFKRDNDLSQAWACTSEMLIADCQRDPLLALLFAPGEWLSKTWAMVLINYEGKVEILELLSPT